MTGQVQIVLPREQADWLKGEMQLAASIARSHMATMSLLGDRARIETVAAWADGIAEQLRERGVGNDG